MYRSKERLFDRLVGAGKERRRDVYADCLGGFQIDNQIELGCSLHGQLTWLLALHPQSSRRQSYRRHTMNLDLGSKWVGLLHELLPVAKDFAVLVNIVDADSARLLITGTQAGCRTLSIRTEFLFASAEDEIDVALDGLGARVQGLIIHPSTPFLQNRAKLAALAIREKLPAVYAIRDFPAAGGHLITSSKLGRCASQQMSTSDVRFGP
jgi:hypothetical protein